jgi:hypothetical protein
VKRYAVFVSSFVSCLLLAAVPMAGQQEKGDSELQVQGALLISTASDVDDSGFASFLWGSFLTDTNELGLNATASFTGDGDIQGLAGPFYRINFGSGTTVPYFGLAALASFGESSGDVFASAELGVRWFLDRNSAFSVSVQQNYDFDQSELSDFLPVVFGFSHFIDRN